MVRALLVLAGLIAAAGAVLWVATPDVANVQADVNHYAAARHVSVLGAGDVPAQLVNAAVATEDERFFVHHGVDILGITRSLGDDIARGCLCEGGSTITQQLVKEIYLHGDDHGARKVEDVVLALKVETVLSKRQVMADYLSIIPTGRNVYGVNAAAGAFYRTRLDRLDLAQYAQLAGMTQAPYTYDPRFDPEAAADRRHQVLRAMLAHGLISAQKMAAADAEPVTARGRGC